MKIVPVNTYIFYDPFSARSKHYVIYTVLVALSVNLFILQQGSDPTAAIKKRMQ